MENGLNGSSDLRAMTGWAIYSAPSDYRRHRICHLSHVCRTVYEFSSDIRAQFIRNLVGLSNYRYALEDSLFWQALTNTFVMGIWSVLLGIALSFVLASLINNLKWHLGRNFFKAVYFLPNVVSGVATSLLFSFLFFPSKEGLINFVIGLFGIDPVGWFTNPEVARYSIVLMSLWGALGYNTIIFLAGLQSVPRDLYEAAEVDGAGTYRKWWYITIPYLRPIFVFMLIMGTIGGMKRFTDVWLIGGTAGNPGKLDDRGAVYLPKCIPLIADGAGYSRILSVIRHHTHLNRVPHAAQPPQRQLGLIPLSILGSVKEPYSRRQEGNYEQFSLAQ